MTSLPMTKCQMDGCEERVEPGRALCATHSVAGALDAAFGRARSGSTTAPVWVMVCEPRRSEGGRADSFLVAWKGEAFDGEVNAIGSMNAGDYGLDDVPGPGLWVLEGTVKLSAYRCNNPLDPEEWDTSIEFDGEFRRPTQGELTAAARGYAPGGVKPAKAFPPEKHQCPDCLALHWRPEEREAVRERWERCAACKEPVTDDYMLRDEVWLAAGGKLGPGGGVLHLRCVEKRLGRKLALEDFADVGINNAIRWAWDRAQVLGRSDR
jgi:hypothetical protein